MITINIKTVIKYPSFKLVTLGQLSNNLYIDGLKVNLRLTLMSKL